MGRAMPCTSNHTHHIQDVIAQVQAVCQPTAWQNRSSQGSLTPRMHSALARMSCLTAPALVYMQHRPVAVRCLVQSTDCWDSQDISAPRLADCGRSPFEHESSLWIQGGSSSKKSHARRPEHGRHDAWDASRSTLSSLRTSDLSAILTDLPQEGTASLRQPYIRWTGEGGHCARRVEPARRRQKVHPGDNFLCTCVRMPAENKRASARRRMHFADKHRAASPQTQWQGRPHRRKRKQP